MSKENGLLNEGRFLFAAALSRKCKLTNLIRNQILKQRING